MDNPAQDNSSQNTDNQDDSAMSYEDVNMNRGEYALPDDNTNSDNSSIDVTGASEPMDTQTPVEEEVVTDTAASVPSELESIVQSFGEPNSADGAVDAQNTSEGVDPMAQIEADEAASVAASEPQAFQAVVPETSTNSGETVDEYTNNESSNEPIEAPNYDNGEPVSAQQTQESVNVEPNDQLAVEPVSVETPVQVGVATDQAVESTLATEAAASPEPTVLQPGAMISDIIAPVATAAAVSGIAATDNNNIISGAPETPAEPTVAAVAPAKPAAPKSKKWLLILVVALVTLLFGGAAVAAYVLKPAAKTATPEAAKTAATDTAKTADPVVQSTPAPGEIVAAKALDDYKVACAAGMVTNAKAYSGAGPHQLVMFEKGGDDKYAMSVPAYADKTWATDSAKPDSGQLVACIAMKPGTEKKLKTCPLTDATTKVTSNIDFYSVDYDVTTYEALTGKKVSSSTVSGLQQECPTTATYSKVDPKLYAGYLLANVESAIKEAVMATITLAPSIPPSAATTSAATTPVAPAKTN
jgi:hypothetical protein